jgi:AcrR family transcriptional regulator
MTTTTTSAAPAARRRDRQREETRLDLALAAFELAREHGLAGVRVPQIAAAAGVSTRTFNNYFASKEEAIAWPAIRRAAGRALSLDDRPAGEPLDQALAGAVAAMYEPGADGFPAGWLPGFRALLAAEPALRGEYRKASDAFEAELAGAIARRTGAGAGDLEPMVLAAVVTGAERAAVRYWTRQEAPAAPLADTIRTAVGMAVRGLLPAA